MIESYLPADSFRFVQFNPFLTGSFQQHAYHGIDTLSLANFIALDHIVNCVAMARIVNVYN